MSRQKKNPGKLDNRLRIIGGLWRGRKLEFPNAEGLRPTPDRVRETLFNWLQNDIVGARCLDLFAGSGALGLEALSRGANQVVMVDENRVVTSQLEKHVSTLQASGGEIRQTDAINLLSSTATHECFDIVFLDPPFGKGLINPCVDALESNNWLAENAKIYIEVEAELRELELPDHWYVIKEKSAGQINYFLVTKK